MLGRVSSIVTAHLYLGMLVAALAVLAVWRRPGRRVTLYIVTLQVLVGIAIAIMGARISWVHFVLAGIGWAGYMAANAVARRQPGKRTALTIAALSSLFILAAYYVGEHTARLATKTG